MIRCPSEQRAGENSINGTTAITVEHVHRVWVVAVLYISPQEDLKEAKPLTVWQSTPSQRKGRVFEGRLHAAAVGPHEGILVPANKKCEHRIPAGNVQKLAECKELLFSSTKIELACQMVFCKCSRLSNK